MGDIEVSKNKAAYVRILYNKFNVIIVTAYLSLWVFVYVISHCEHTVSFVFERFD